VTTGSAPRWAVVLAGGVGSRFWPLSTPERPKQLLPLITERPMLSDTLRRLGPLAPAERTLVLTNASLADAVRRLAPELPADNVIAEPKPAGTAAALTWAAAEIERRAGRDAVMICVHADWSIGDEEGFRRTLARAADAAERNSALVTVGIVPVRPDTGFGYIQPADTADEATGARKVARFVEKPDRARAEDMVRHGYLWNSGIFVWRVGDFLDEVRALTPEVAPALASSGEDLEQFFGNVKSISVDVGVLERSARVLVLAGDFGWDDVGTWAALRRVRQRDAGGNAASGDVHAVESRGNVVHAEGNTVVLYGVDDLVVVTRAGLTVVTTVDRAADLKRLVEALPAGVREPG
jgi:mannose-1-phosphate guanylyltransferase